MATLTLRSLKGSPLSNTEVDLNFTALNQELEQKLFIEDFNPGTILSRLLTADGIGSGLDSDFVRGLELSTDPLPNTIAQRSTSGNLSANLFLAVTGFQGNLVGNVTGNVSGTASGLSQTLVVTSGGTGATTPVQARTNLGLGNISVQNINSVNLTGGQITGMSLVAATNLTGYLTGDVSGTSANIRGVAAVVNGGTSATTPVQARTNLGLAIGSNVQAWSTTLDSLVNPSIDGLLGKYQGQVRNLTVVPGSNISVVNGNGKAASGNISVGLNSSITLSSVSATTLSGTLTGNVTGNVTGSLFGNSTTASRLQTPRTINGVAFDGTQNIVVEASDPNSGAPVGSILYYPSASVPVGWMMCAGQQISKTIYPLLFSKIGYTFGGSGDFFRLPDLRGEFIRGWDGGRGVDSGRLVGSPQKGTLNVTDPNYGSHNVQGVIGRYDYPGGTSGPVDPQFNVEVGMDQISSTDYPNVMLSSVGGRTPINLGTSGFSYGATRPRNVALVACIKVFGEIDEPDQITANSVLNYVNSLPRYVITYGNTQYSTTGWTNAGSWRDTSNYFDVFPPAGKTMVDLIAFIPSIAVIWFAGVVDGNDEMRCTWSNLGDRIRVWVQNSEQRSTPAANWLAIWSN
jgi:microcystin-dependent protein